MSKYNNVKRSRDIPVYVVSSFSTTPCMSLTTNINRNPLIQTDVYWYSQCNPQFDFRTIAAWRHVNWQPDYFGYFGFCSRTSKADEDQSSTSFGAHLLWLIRWTQTHPISSSLMHTMTLVYMHDTTGCQTGWTAGWTTGWMFVYTMQTGCSTAVEQPVASCIQTLNRLSNRLNNHRLKGILKVLHLQ